MKKKPIVIQRIMRPRFVGVATAAAKLGVSKSAVSNFVSGRCTTAISQDKATRIKIINL